MRALMRTISIARFRRSANVPELSPGRWPGLLHFAPLALKTTSNDFGAIEYPIAQD
jgi:hypothetical protein